MKSLPDIPCRYCGKMFPAYRKDSRYCSAVCLRRQRTIDARSQPNPRYKHWTLDGLYCKQSNQNCDECVIFKAYGLKYGAGCFFPQSIEFLEKNGIEIPLKLLGETLL